VTKVFIDLEVITHLFGLQNKKEQAHREKNYKEDERVKNVVDLEVRSSLYYLYCNILSIASMSHDIPEYEKTRMRKKMEGREENYSTTLSHHVLKGE
jgi:hypothetical protein